MSKRVQTLLPWLVLGLSLAFVVVMLAQRPNHTGDFDLEGFARLPVSSEGRVKPMDTVARTNLMVFSGRQTLRTDTGREPAIRWLLDVLGRPDQARQHEIFRIDHPGVLGLLGVQQGEATYFSLDRIRRDGSALQQQAQQAMELEDAQRNAYQNQVLKLSNHLTRYVELARLHTPYIVPPTSTNDEWRPYPEAMAEPIPDPSASALTTMLHAYENNAPPRFNEALARYQDHVANVVPNEVTKARFEVFFNRFQPFYQAAILCVAGFGLGVLGWLVWPEPFRRSSVATMALVFALFTFGLAARIYLQGRPPVTNLYSSAIFVGWGCVAFGLILEWIYRNGIPVVAAAIIGFATLVIAHTLATGDTMEMMQAVLDTNFWLATHVVTITIGYSATFFAGALGLIFILRGLLTRSLTPEARQTLGRMIYGVVCFALLFSFVGTVLGGIWADQSWGRFWGWDPKENGAALIVLMNALILHARWGGMVRERGIAVLAIGGNIITAWSWFGTNLLGVGLHSYGFTDSGAFWLSCFVLSQLLVISLGLLPLDLWRSGKLMMQPPNRKRSPATAAPAGNHGPISGTSTPSA